MARRGWRPKRGRMVSGASMVDSSAGHSPPAIGVPAGPGRAQARQRVGQRFAGLAGPQRVGRARIVSAAAMVASSRASGAAPVRHARRERPTSRASSRSIRSIDGGADRLDRRTGLLDVGADRRHAGRGLQPAQALAVEPARGIEQGGAIDRPSVHSGCFSRASRATGAKPASTAATSARSSAAGGVSASGCAGRIVDVDVPAPQLGGDAAREVAVGRDQGGGAACVCPAPRAAPGRSTSASWCGVAQSARVTCSSDGGDRAAARRRWSRPAASARRSADARADRRRARPVGDVAALAAERRQQLAQAELRMRSGRACLQLSSSISRSRPGSTTAPCGRPAMTASSSRVAGCEPVEPAAITGVAGGRSRQRAAWARIAWVRRSMASIWPRSARICGQCSPTMARNFSVRCQWLAKLPSTSAFELVERHAVDGELVEQAGRARARASAPAPPTARSAGRRRP